MASRNQQYSNDSQKTSNSSILGKTIRNISTQFFVATLLIILSFVKHQLYQNPYMTYKKHIYSAYLLFVLSVWFSKVKGGRNQFIDFILYALSTVSLIWIILYQCGYLPKEFVVNFFAAMLGSALGLYIYIRRNKSDFNDKVDLVGGLASSTVGIAIAINLISYIFESFSPISMAVALIFSILFSVSFMKISNQMMTTYSIQELQSTLRNVSIYYWSLPKYIFTQLKWLSKKTIEYQYI